MSAGVTLLQDTLESILAVASEVMEECAPDPGNTRLERLSRYLVASLGDVRVAEPATVGYYVVSGERVPCVWVGWSELNPDEARQAAASMLRAVDEIENG